LVIFGIININCILFHVGFSLGLIYKLALFYVAKKNGCNFWVRYIEVSFVRC